MQHDPLELRNQVEAPEQADVLRQMRAAYDRLHTRARASCIQANQYPAFLDSADRTVRWSDKTWTARPATRPAEAAGEGSPR